MGKITEWWLKQCGLGKASPEKSDALDALGYAKLDLKPWTVHRDSLLNALNLPTGKLQISAGQSDLISGYGGAGTLGVQSTEAFIRIERAANGRIVKVARNEGEQFKQWLVPEGTDVMEVIKLALADLRV
jgi:hypothetical protein